jgi:signal transduction histidine kinase
MYLYYDDSIILKKLLVYPYVQFGAISVFIAIAFLALASTKKAEQNKVWVGLSKETAHQLGTPISSLIAWVEYLKTKNVDANYLDEMEKDVKRLEVIADRFSKIGAKPGLTPIDINQALQTACQYMQNRISSKVKVNIQLQQKQALALMNQALFAWIVENLIKNAVDAMDGQGNIHFIVSEKNNKIVIDTVDSGKGIHKAKFKTVFNPGYTTKNRGWGLGLSLVKRIVESYPGGKIYVKNSELNKGTTFRIEMNKCSGTGKE